MSTNELTFGERLQDIRKSKGLTQKQVGEAIGMSHQTIGGYENGISFPDRERLIALANLFDVTVDYLIARVDYNAVSVELESEYVEVDGERVSVGRVMETLCGFDEGTREWFYGLLGVVVRGGGVK